MNAKVNLYSDGGARGNPGPAAAAFLIVSESGELLKQQARFLGKRTNNQAEYEALISALESASGLGADEVFCHLDSELVCRHLTGEYKVKNLDLKRLWSRAQELLRCFRRASFVSVARTNPFIQRVDALVNESLDKAVG